MSSKASRSQTALNTVLKKGGKELLFCKFVKNVTVNYFSSKAHGKHISKKILFHKNFFRRRANKIYKGGPQNTFEKHAQHKNPQIRKKRSCVKSAKVNFDFSFRFGNVFFPLGHRVSR